MPPDTLTPTPSTSAQALQHLWRLAKLPMTALNAVQLTGAGAVLPSSFNLATAAQSSLAAAGAAALQIGRLRGGATQTLSLDREHALLACSAHLLIDGVAPPVWDPVSGLYACGAAVGQPGWVRIHANFGHHRDAALRVLGLPEGPAADRSRLEAALAQWPAETFESAVAAAGGAASAARSLAQWQAHPQGQALAGRPVLRWHRIGDAPPRPWPNLTPGGLPLHGLRMLDLTRILAGPLGAQVLASLGAQVLMVNAPHLPNIAHIADFSRGKRSALLDLRDDGQRAQLQALAGGAHVLLQGYRPGALAALGLSPSALAERYPGLVIASLSAYDNGDAPDGSDEASGGPWATRRGFDSLVQTATGFNLDEAEAAGSPTPRALPVQALDCCAGHLLAFGIQVALLRQATEGGSWAVQVSLAGVGQWLRSLDRLPDGLQTPAASLAPYLMQVDSGFGRLTVLRPALQLSHTPVALAEPAQAPGSHPAIWV